MSVIGLNKFHGGDPDDLGLDCSVANYLRTGKSNKGVTDMEWYWIVLIVLFFGWVVYTA